MRLYRIEKIDRGSAGLGNFISGWEDCVVVVFGSRRFFNGSECFAELIDVTIVEGLSTEKKEGVFLV